MGKRRSRSSSSSSGSSKNSSVSRTSEKSVEQRKSTAVPRKHNPKHSKSQSLSKSRSPASKSKVLDSKRRKKMGSPSKREKKRSRSRDNAPRKKKQSSRSSSRGKSRVAKTNGEQVRASNEKWKRRTISNKGESGGKTAASEQEQEKLNKFQLLNFGKNNYGDSYDYNVHIRVCLNCDRIRKLGLPKANTVRLSKLYNEAFVSGLQAHWAKRKGSQKDKKMRSLFDRSDLKKFLETDKEKTEERRAEKSLSDRWRKSDKKEKVSQVVKLDVKSFESFPTKNGRNPTEDAAKGSAKKRLGQRPNDSSEKSPVKDRRDTVSLTRDDRERLDPKFVPTTGRYFLHDDREDRDYFGRRRSPGRFSNNNERRALRRGGYESSNRGRQSYTNQRDAKRKSSPDVWKHDKFGVNSEEEMECSDDEKPEEPKSTEGRKSSSPRNRGGQRKDSKDFGGGGNENYSGQQPFYSQLQSEQNSQSNNNRSCDRRQPSRRSPPSRYRDRRSRSRDQLRNRQRRSPPSWRQSRQAPYSRRRTKTKSKSRSRSDSRNNRNRNRNRTPLKSRRSRSRSRSSSSSSSSRNKSKSPPAEENKKETNNAITKATENISTAAVPVVESTKEKIVNYENEDDIIEESKAVLSEVDGIGDAGRDYDHVDMDLINKLTQGSAA